MDGIGPQLPLSRDNKSGNYSLINLYKNEVKQNFKNLMLTAPGERVMIPDFGVGLRHYLFEPELGLASEIKSKIFSQVAKYMSFIVIKNINFYPVGQSPGNPNMLSVAIEYSVPGIGLNSTLTLNNATSG